MKDRYFIELGKMLKAIREERNITQQFVADKLNTTDACISFYEKGLRKISVIDFQKVCKIYKVNSEDILSQLDKYID